MLDDIEIPKLDEPMSFEEAIHQMSILSEAIGRCEKVLQHFALTGFLDGTDEIITKHIMLTSIRNRLYKKIQKMREPVITSA